MSKLKVPFAVVKIVAIAVGGFLTVLSLMAIVGLFTDNGWARLGVAVLVAGALPALVADRLLPGDDTRSNGLVTDVFAVMWMGFALLFVGVLAGATGGLLRVEAQRLEDSGYKSVANAAAWIAQPAASATAATPLVSSTSEPKEQAGSEATVVKTTIQDAGPTASADSEDAGVKAQPKKDSYSPAEVFTEWSPAVVTITTTSGYGMGGGTGFIIDKTGVVVTNHHVIEDASNVAVKLLDGKWASEVELLVQDEKLDIAILKITTSEGLKVVDLGKSEDIQVGERAISIGNPLGLEHTLTDGIVSARRTIEGKKMIQMSTPISPGNSGGPLFNLKGEVIGVSTASVGGFSRAQNLNLAIPIDEVKGLIKDDYPDRKRIGGGSSAGKGTW